MQFIFCYLRQRRRGILGFFLCVVIFVFSFILYHLPVEAVLYPTLLCCFIGLLLLGIDIRRAKAKHQRLVQIQSLPAELIGDFPVVDSAEDDDYQKIIRLLCEEQARKQNSMNMQYVEMIDYYTVWAHQIKTPIASLRLNLQNEDSEFSRKAAEDVQRIEQYVEMVLVYLRLDSDATDYIIKEYDLDEIVRPTVRKLSTQFIRKRISLEYQSLSCRVVTDEKWLSFVIEQVLSNALKYTPNGSISIFMEEPKTLCIRDTGIGIAPEDLPRIFEKGYTGYNGRSDKRASGIGLYLCKRICGNLGHDIQVESSVGCGTTVRINLHQKKLEVE